MSENEKQMMKEIDSWTEKADEEIGGVLNDKMCSRVCPCYYGADDENWNQYSDFTEEELNEYKRKEKKLRKKPLSLSSF